MRPRLANLVAAYLRAPPARAHLARALSSRGARLVNDWVVIESELPASEAPLARPSEHRINVEGAMPGADSDPRFPDLRDGVPPFIANSPGDFGLVWLGHDGDFVAARSCGGRVPIYTCRDASSVWISTTLEALVKFRVEEPRLDVLVNALWTERNAVFPDGRTFLEGVSIVPRGHCLVSTSRGQKLHTYWDPRRQRMSPESGCDLEEHAAELRSALIETLAIELDRDTPNLLTLSGGLDSSALAWLAARLRLPLTTLTFLAPAGSTALKLQEERVDDIIREFNVQHAWKYGVDDESLTALFALPLPSLFHCPHPALRLLPDLARQSGARVAFSGHFADELCGYSQRLQDWIHHTTLLRLLDPRYEGPSGSFTNAGRWLKRRTLAAAGRPLLPVPRTLQPWFPVHVRAEMAEWSSRTVHSLVTDSRPLRELAAWCLLDGWVAMQWDCSSPQGVRPVHPFFTRRTLDLAFRCHPRELFGPGTKKLLRTALAGSVPGPILAAPTKQKWPPRREERRYSMPFHPGELSGMLDDEFASSRRTLTAAEYRKLLQLVLFVRKLKEVRHAGKETTGT